MNRYPAKPAIPAFAQYVAAHGRMSARLVRLDVRIYNCLTPDSRARLRGACDGIKQSWLKALSDLPPQAQARALDRIDQGLATTLKAAVAVENRAAQASRQTPTPIDLRHVPTSALVSELRARVLSGDGAQHE